MNDQDYIRAVNDILEKSIGAKMNTKFISRVTSECPYCHTKLKKKTEEVSAWDSQDNYYLKKRDIWVCNCKGLTYLSPHITITEAK
jgi:uncharacterized protein with PIN domain